MRPGDTRYARVVEAQVAYQVAGDGPIDVVIAAELGRYIAERVAGARFVQRPGFGVNIENADDETFDLIEEFLTGASSHRRTERVLATILYTDIVGSTDSAAAVGDKRWKERLDEHDRLSRQLVDRFGGRTIKTTGDGVLATFGAPGRALRSALSLAYELRDIGIDIRCGVHTGEVELRDGGDIGGLAAHIGARVTAMAGPGEIWCSRTVRDLVAGAGFLFEDRGTHTLKGVPDDWQVFVVKES